MGPFLVSSSNILAEGRYAYTVPPALGDPDAIEPSPSASARARLSEIESPPSAATSESRSTPPTSPHQPLPAMETIPDIPDSGSLLSRLGAPLPSVAAVPSVPHAASQNRGITRQLAALSTVDDEAKTPTPSVVEKKSKSKLSALASSRTSMYSQTSRASSVDAESVMTYPQLRPSNRSAYSLRPQSTDPSTYQSDASGASGFSSLARHAVEAAMKQEALDHVAGDTRSSVSSDTGSDRTVKLGSPEVQVSARSNASSPAPSSKSGKPMSKLAMLAQAQAKSPQGQAGASLPSKPTSHASSDSLLNRTHTQYLTPIANGPTVTTAITTTYQSLASLTPPSRSGLPMSKMSTPVPTVPLSSGSAEPPRSKLAMKSRKYKTASGVVVVEEESYAPPPEMPIFLPRTSGRSRASPSAFASLLVDDVAVPSRKDKDGRPKDREGRKSRKAEEVPSKRSSRSRAPPDPTALQVSPNSFAFDVPSPDDVVQSARRGTALGSSRSTRAGVPS
jgi:hypothetical protein